MFKLAIESEDLFRKLFKLPILGRFFVFRIDCLSALRDQKLAAHVYKGIRTSDGTTKHTASERFRDLDALVVDYLSLESNVIHDVAVSSGITSVELYSVLRGRGIPFKLMVSDKFSHYLYRGNRVRKIYSVNKTLLFAYVGWILVDRKCSWKFPLSKLLFPLVRAFDQPSPPYGSIPLYESRLLELIREGHVEELSYDIFSTSIPDQFTFVRCMNVLNLDYFKPGDIIQALVLLRDSLKDQGVLLLGRTLPNGVNAVSFYKKVRGQFELIQDVNGGSEVSYLVKSIRQV